MSKGGTDRDFKICMPPKVSHFKSFLEMEKFGINSRQKYEECYVHFADQTIETVL